VLERQSGLHCGSDFTVGYSPERINPGDTAHSFSTITKIVSGQDERTLNIVASVYESVVSAGVHRASSIQVAEAAKVLENIQRDVNISLMNEVAMIFNRIGLDTQDVLAAARTKWNFLPFTPGLVGGHCIGVDPYYLAHKAQQLGYVPQVITAARRINDGMGEFVAQCALTHLSHLGCLIQESTITVLGLAFKENVSDLRNTRVVDIVRALKQQGITVQIHDPLVDRQEALEEYDISLSSESQLQKSQCVILATSHSYYVQRGWEWLRTLLDDNKAVVIDVKGILPRDTVPENIHLWRL
jgi:UDP-N-acetyl-D-galactosamine dehydrogenase